MRSSGHLGLSLLTLALLQLASSRRLQSESDDFQHLRTPSLADFGAKIPDDITVSEVERDAIIQKLIEARDDEEANRCTISLEPILVNGTIGPNGLVVVVEPPGEGSRAGAAVRVNMYNVPAARRWYCVQERRPVDPVINLPLRTTSRVFALTELGGPLCAPRGSHPVHDVQGRLLLPQFEELCTTVWHCELDRLRELLPTLPNATFSARDLSNRTALFRVVERNCMEAAQLLLPRMDRDSVGVQDVGGRTVLQLAAARGLYIIAQKLIPRMSRAAVQARSRIGMTALAFAALHGRPVITAAILRVTAPRDLAIQNDKGETALHHACRDSFRTPRSAGVDEVDYAAVIHMLLDKMDEDTAMLQDENGMNALHHAVKGGLTEAVGALVEGMSERAVEAQNSNGMTALHLAARYGKDVAVDLLLAVARDELLYAPTSAGHSALQLAMARERGGGCTDDCMPQQHIVGELLKRMNHSAAMSRHIADRDNLGMTALHYAAYRADSRYAESIGFIATVRLLLQYMADGDVAAADRDGRTALSRASEKGMVKFAEELLSRMDDAAICAQDVLKMTALHYAALAGNVELVGNIADRMDRAALNVERQKDGKTALELAKSVGHTGCSARIQMRLMLAP